MDTSLDMTLHGVIGGGPVVGHIGSHLPFWPRFERRRREPRGQGRKEEKEVSDERKEGN